MKTAVAFLLLALSCCFDHSSAYKKIPDNCIARLLQCDVPQTLIKLGNVLCMYADKQDEDNEALYTAFLVQLHATMKDLGCGADDILGTKDYLEQLGDKAGHLAHEVVYEILTAVDDLGVFGTVMELSCSLAGGVIISLGEALQGKLDLNLFSILKGLKTSLL